MAELFLRFNATGVIQQIILNHWKVDISKSLSVFSLFDEPTNLVIHEALTASTSEIDIALTSQAFPRILLRSAMHSFFLFVTTENYTDSQFLEIRHLLDFFVIAVASEKPSNPIDAKGYYEQMQFLNNELVNKGRMIEKMNRQLNELNLKQEELIRTDPLTKLISRYVFPQQIVSKISEHCGKKGMFCYLDIDDFKRINDTLGHQAGDDFLIEFARRLNAAPIDNALKMRIAGDEFGVFIYNLDAVTPERCEAIWKILQSTVARPMQLGNTIVPVAFSLGFAVYPDDSEDVHRLFDNADKAMYAAKRKGINLYACYNRIKEV
jgi:diguanylate cyclase (GGDEF)-like protein